MIKAIRITAIIAALLVLGFFGLQLWLGNKVRSAIERQVGELSGGIYMAQVGSVKVNLLGGSVNIKDIILKADTAAKGSGVPPVILNFSVEKIKADGIGLGMLRNPEKIELRSLTLVSPDITVHSYRTDTDGGPAKEGAQAVGEIHTAMQAAAGVSAEAASPAEIGDKKEKGGMPRVFSIGVFRLTDGDIALHRHKDGDIADFTLRGLQLEVEDFSTDTADAASRKLRWANLVDLYAERFEYVWPDDSNILTVDSVRFDSQASVFSVRSLDLSPQYPMEEYVYKNKKQADWTKVSTGAIRISGIEPGMFIRDKILRIDSISIETAVADSYKDRNADQPPKVKQTFYEGLQRLPFGLDVRAVHFGSTDVTYRELAHGASEAGVINFKELFWDFHGLSNIPSEQDPFFTLTARAKIYGTGDIHATFYLPKDSLTNRFEVTGSLGTMDLPVMNRMFKPLMNVEITSGTVDRMTFHIAGNKVRSNVNMLFEYGGLKVELLKEDGSVRKQRKFLSWLVNTAVVISDNPQRKGAKPREGSGQTERDFHRSQYNYLWRSLMPGIKESVGL